MENRGPVDREASCDSPVASNSPRPRSRQQQTPADNDLARALLGLSFSSPQATPTDAIGSNSPASRPSSDRLSDSYPSSPLGSIPRPYNPDDGFSTPFRRIHEALPTQYLRPNHHESTPKPEDLPAPPRSDDSTQLPSPRQTPELSALPKPRTVVILHDSCMKHKFSRNVKARELASIVERPERYRASVLGIAAAKARLELEKSRNLTFDIVKSTHLGSLSDVAVTDVHGSSWPLELTTLCQGVADTLAKGDLEIPPPYHSGDLYLGEGSHEAFQGCIGAVYDGVDRVLADDYDRVHVSVRPPGHHCGETMPSGFCMINNVHVAIAYAHHKYGINRAVILDFDLHHGDGSQSIAWSINKKPNRQKPASRSPRCPGSVSGLRVGYFSLHDIYSFPCEDGAPQKIQDASICLNAHGQAIWNVHLRHHPTETAFDEIYDSEYSLLFKKAAQFLADANADDKCMVFLSAGFDASEHESKGMQRHGYNLPTTFYQMFARDAIALADSYASGKIVSVLEGGYADRAITSGTFAYMVGLAGVTEDSAICTSRNWWSIPQLTMLEKWSKKPSATKINHGLPNGTDLRWVQQTLEVATALLPSAFASCDSARDLSVPATPRMELRERKKPVIPATAPPSTTKKRQQRIATPRTRKSASAAENFQQNADNLPGPKPFEREVSPGTDLSVLMQTMKIGEGDVKFSGPRFEKAAKSPPGTPTPLRTEK